MALDTVVLWVVRVHALIVLAVGLFIWFGITPSREERAIELEAQTRLDHSIRELSYQPPTPPTTILAHRLRMLMLVG